MIINENLYEDNKGQVAYINYAQCQIPKLKIGETYTVRNIEQSSFRKEVAA